jgi:hypothetical protein
MGPFATYHPFRLDWLQHTKRPVSSSQIARLRLALEVNQFQELLIAEFQRVSQQRKVLLPIQTLDKQVRIRRLGTYLAQRKQRFKRRSGGTALLVEQLRDFPVGENDNGPDALEMALRFLSERWNGKGRNPHSPNMLTV